MSTELEQALNTVFSASEVEHVTYHEQEIIRTRIKELEKTVDEIWEIASQDIKVFGKYADIRSLCKKVADHD